VILTGISLCIPMEPLRLRKRRKKKMRKRKGKRVPKKLRKIGLKNKQRARRPGPSKKGE